MISARDSSHKYKPQGVKLLSFVTTGKAAEAGISRALYAAPGSRPGRAGSWTRNWAKKDSMVGNGCKTTGAKGDEERGWRC